MTQFSPASCYFHLGSNVSKSILFWNIHGVLALLWETKFDAHANRQNLSLVCLVGVNGSELYLRNHFALIYSLLIITPIFTYGIELWGCACKSNIAVIQRRQSKILRATFDAPWYVTNDMIHKQLGIPTVHEVIYDRSIKHRTKLESHSKPLLQLLSRDVIRRLKRRWPADL